MQAPWNLLRRTRIGLLRQDALGHAIANVLFFAQQHLLARRRYPTTAHRIHPEAVDYISLPLLHPRRLPLLMPLVAEERCWTVASHLEWK